jgi:MFS family permease
MAKQASDSEKISSSHLEDKVNGLDVDTTPIVYDRFGRPLVPQPSDDANDPLNWSTLRKVAIIIVVAARTFLGTFNMIIAGPTFFAVAAELETNLELTTYLVGGPILSYGVASLFWVAAGNRFGVRLCFLASSLAAAALSIWAAKTPTFGQLVAARTLASIAFAAPETLGPQVIGDVFFLKDRAKCMAFVVAMQASGFALGPLVGSFIVRDLGWRWTEWIMVILTFGVAVMIILLLPETQYTSDPSFVVSKRRASQNFAFTRVSGRGQAKVHRYLVQSRHVHYKCSLALALSLLSCIPSAMFAIPCYLL